jgi:hypothetical protein
MSVWRTSWSLYGRFFFFFFISGFGRVLLLLSCC